VNLRLASLLESAYERHHRLEFIEADPLNVPHGFSHPGDIEIAAFFSALIAWGNRRSIVRSALGLMDRMDRAPYAFVVGASESELDQLEGFVHRTFFDADARTLIYALRGVLRAAGSLEAAFRPLPGEPDVYPAIVRFRQAMVQAHPLGRTQKHLSNPDRGSAAKRIALFLRWMVRRDTAGIDFGLWSSIDPALLVLPLDVHTARTARNLGLLQRKANDRRAVEELMTALRTFDAADPVRYDFALFGLSIETTPA